MKKDTAIIIFGITGHLSVSKLLPALFDLGGDYKIIGFSRRDLNPEEFNEEISTKFFKSYKGDNKEKANDFLQSIDYFSGSFIDPDSYRKLEESLKDYPNKVFYLAIPPSLYEAVLTNIKTDKSSKILIEKPFGTDLESAKSLDKLLGKFFGQSQIYKVDHYLGKDFGEVDLENLEKVEINVFESSDIGSRGEFYDRVGAFRDVGQSHLLALLNIVLGKPTELIDVYRAQYQDYIYEKGVAKDSQTETFFRITGLVGDKKFTLSSGKGLKENKAEIKLFVEGKKDPIIRPITGSGYNNVFIQALKGDKDIFPSTEDVLDQWKFTEIVLKKMSESPMQTYKKGELL